MLFTVRCSSKNPARHAFYSVFNVVFLENVYSKSANEATISYRRCWRKNPLNVGDRSSHVNEGGETKQRKNGSDCDFSQRQTGKAF